MSYITLGVEGAGVVVPEGRLVVAPRLRGHGPTSTWERFRPIIKQLYVDEDKTLKEVMSILEREHGHVGTVKQYKGRIKAWGFDKNNKDDEASAVLRMKTRRAAVGKNSAFRVRGKPVTVDDVYRYYRRKGILDPDSHAQRPGVSTPPAIECWTPVSSTSPKVNTSRLTKDGEVNESESPKLRSLGLEEMSVTETFDATHQVEDRLALLSIDQVRDILFSDPLIQSFEVPQSPLPPRCFLVPEKLLASTKAYLNGLLDGKCNAQLHLVNEASAQFVNTCLLASEMTLSGSFVDGRRLFSRATSHLGNMLLHERTRCVDAILKTFLFLKSKGFFDIVKSLRYFASGLTTIFYADAHPLVKIFACIESLDEPNFELATLQAWRCICDEFFNSLGQFHPSTLICHTNFVVIEGQLFHNDASKPIHKLLVQAERELDNSDPRLLFTKILYSKILFRQRLFAEILAIIGEINVSNPETYHHSNIIDLLQISGICHHHLGHNQEAESKFRQAIKRSEVLLGSEHMFTLSCKSNLRRFFQYLGRHSEADLLAREIDCGIGVDDIDVMDVVAFSVSS